MTRSGRCYAPINLEAKEGEEFVEEGRVKITVQKGKDKEVRNESVTEAEANEFSNS